MNRHIDNNHKLIISNGVPEAVIIPYDDYLRMSAKPDSDVTVPHEVVELIFLQKLSTIQAWRKYLNLTQAQVAECMGISQSAYSQMEKPNANLRPSTLLRIAEAMGIEWEQLDAK